MKPNKLFTIMTLVLCFIATSAIYGQTGGRRKEHRNQRGGGSIFKRSKSGGHADAFAKGKKKGFIARLFKGNKGGGAWVYRKTNPGTKQKKEQGQLFSRFRTKNKRYRDGVIANQNKRRTNVRNKSKFKH